MIRIDPRANGADDEADTKNHRFTALISAALLALPLAEVEARHGAPADRMDPRGGQKSQWPTIHRWVYPQFTVYFEQNRVIDAVLNKADPTEVGPKPAIR